MTMAPLLVAAIILPALICAGVAIVMRARLRAAPWSTWLGYALIGAGVPVLVGQGGALLVVGGGDALMVQLLLAAGLSGGLGWAAGAISARVTGSGTDS